MSVFRGIFPIVVTPFTENYELDAAGLRRIVRFSINAGAHGLVGPANASEFMTLSDDERRQWLEIVIDETGGQIPVIAAVNAGHWLPAIELSRFSEALGAAGLMSMPPYVIHPDGEGCYEFYQKLDAAVNLPIFIQNYNGPVGTPMSAALLARMCRDFHNDIYLKEETVPSSRAVSKTIAAAGDACKGVFGGQGGIYLIDDYNRGSTGNMPACQVVDAHVAIWNKLESGDLGGARQLFNQLLPLINYERQYGVALYKEVLYRRGVISTTVCRIQKPLLDDPDRAELDAILADISPLFAV